MTPVNTAKPAKLPRKLPHKNHNSVREAHFSNFYVCFAVFGVLWRIIVYLQLLWNSHLPDFQG